MRIFAELVGFEWDDGNRDKSLIKHGVSRDECEEAFADEKRLIRVDAKHSGAEMRHHLLGKTQKGKILFISFTVRSHRVRVISARPINRKEKTLYEN